MKINQVTIGTKLSFWHPVATDSQGNPTLGYAEVIKVGKVKIKVRDEYGGEAWKYPAFFSHIVTEETWREVTGK